MPVVALLVVMGVLAHSNSLADEALASVDHAWFLRFAKAMEKPDRRVQYRADPDLQAVVSLDADESSPQDRINCRACGSKAIAA